MTRKFLKIYNLIMEDIALQRKPIRKIDAMTPEEFIKFLKEFLPYVKNGEVDINDIRITEKIDGSAIQLIWVNNDMKFESSYSGVIPWNKLPFPDAGKFLYETYRLIFRDIAEQFGDFKIKGELIWINELEENNKVTPIGASYLADKFGKFGGIVVFEIYKIDGAELTRFTTEEENIIMDMIKDMNNDEFSFYLSQDIILNKNVNFTLDVDKLLTLISDPIFNKEKFDKVEDASIIQEIEKIQEDVVQQLSNIIDNSKGAFSAEGDLIEGIVLKINKSENQYGVFSRGYKDMKHIYWELFETIKPIYIEFLKKIYGYSQLRYIKLHWNEIDKEIAQNNLNKIKAEYITKVQTKIDEIKQLNIPTNTKLTQINMAKGILAKIKNLNNVEDIIKTDED